MCFKLSDQHSKTCWYSIYSSFKKKEQHHTLQFEAGTVVKCLKIVLLHAIKRYDIIWDSILS